jgi:hypothetical protein
MEETQRKAWIDNYVAKAWTDQRQAARVLLAAAAITRNEFDAIINRIDENYQSIKDQVK